MEILESFFFDSPLGLVGLVVCDTDNAVKAYVGPIPNPSTGAMGEDVCADLIARLGAECSLQMALALCKRSTWERAAKYVPTIAAMFASPAPPAPPVHAFNSPEPPWTPGDMAARRANYMAQVMPCGCRMDQAYNCWKHFGMSRNLMCHWRGAAAEPVGRSRDAQGPDVGRRAVPAETIDTGTAAACNCTHEENHQCFFVGALRRPGCVHQAEYRAQLAKDTPGPAPATGLAHEE